MVKIQIAERTAVRAIQVAAAEKDSIRTSITLVSYYILLANEKLQPDGWRGFESAGGS